MPGRTIFRESALAAYKRGREKDVVPRLISWPIIIGFWLLLGVLIASVLLTWGIQVPIYVNGSGIILAAGDILRPADGETVAVVFLPADQSAHLRVGLPVHVQPASVGAYAQGTIAQVEPGLTSPDVVRKRYRLDGANALLITQPSTVVIVNLGTTLPATIYAGSLCTAKVEIGYQPLLALFPGLGRFLGGGS